MDGGEQSPCGVANDAAVKDVISALRSTVDSSAVACRPVDIEAGERNDFSLLPSMAGTYDSTSTRHSRGALEALGNLVGPRALLYGSIDDMQAVPDRRAGVYVKVSYSGKALKRGTSYLPAPPHFYPRIST